MVMEVEYYLPPACSIVDYDTKLPGLHAFQLRHLLHPVTEHTVNLDRRT